MKPDFITRPRIRQSGYALILMVLALMGIGGVVLVGFTQGAKVESEQQRFLHNQRVLKEAKQALLQYAYNYPQMGPGQNDGPGRLPCPDTDNDGAENYVASCNGDMLGRFPWKVAGLDFYDARDASGEPLWYAVSNNFGRGGSSTINSDTRGSITVQDRSGAVLYDGTSTTRASGVAAVIIAPGAPIARNGAMQVRGTADEKKDEENYLDLFGTVDNADFVNDDLNGFVTGPIHDVVSGDLLVNDQMIVITAAEVTAMAEMATLQAYRSAILDYLTNTGGVYPWLYNYEGIEYNKDAEPVELDVAIDKLSSFFPAGSCAGVVKHTEAECAAGGGIWDASFANEKATYLGIDTAGNNDGIFGRIPSIFADYFTETDSEPVETRLSGAMTLINSSDSVTVTATTTCDKACIAAGNLTFELDPDPTVEPPTLNIDFTQVLTGVRFVDIDPASVDNEVRLRAILPVAESIPFELFFWGVHDDETTVWTACPGGANELSDCNFEDDRSILRIWGTIDFDDSDSLDVVADFDFDQSSPPTIVWSPANGAAHASIAATYPGSAIVSIPGVFSNVKYEFDLHWHSGDTAIIDGDHGNEDYSTGGTLDMRGFSTSSLTLSMRYFPELPSWTFDNDWHNAIRMAYALEYEPGAVPPPPCGVNTTCLYLEDSAGAPRNVISLLVLAGQHDWTDGVEGDPTKPANGRLKNDLLSVFDNGNENTNPTFYRHRGNDKVLVIEER